MKNIFKDEIAKKRAALRIANKQYPKDKMVQMPQELVQSDGHKLRIASFRSFDFLAQVFGIPGSDMLRLTVQRMDVNRHGAFIDLITWDDLQWVKRQCGFGECDAVEAYPSDKDISVTNGMRILFIFPPHYEVPFFFRKQEQQDVQPIDTTKPDGQPGDESKVVRLEQPGEQDATNAEAVREGENRQPDDEAPALPKLQDGLNALRALRKL